MDLPFFIYQIKTQAVRLAVVMRMATNRNRAANVGKTIEGQDSVRSQLGKRGVPFSHRPINCDRGRTLRLFGDKNRNVAAERRMGHYSAALFGGARLQEIIILLL